MNDWVVKIGDVLFGWLLILPATGTLFVVAIGSSLILAVVRKWTTNQDLLRRCAADKKRLKQLIREAKNRGDKDAVARHRATNAKVGLIQFKQEDKPLLAAILPLALLATWAFGRLEFHPPQVGDTVEVVAHLPASSAGKLAHLVPQPGLTAETGWMQAVNTVGEAHWKLSIRQPVDGWLEFRINGETYRHRVRAGHRTYEPSLVFHDDRVQATEVRMQQVKLFGIVPGIPSIGLAPWLVAYLLIVIPFVVINKRLLRIY